MRLQRVDSLIYCVLAAGEQFALVFADKRVGSCAGQCGRHVPLHRLSSGCAIQPWPSSRGSEVRAPHRNRPRSGALPHTVEPVLREGLPIAVEEQGSGMESFTTFCPPRTVCRSARARLITSRRSSRKPLANGPTDPAPALGTRIAGSLVLRAEAISCKPDRDLPIRLAKDLHEYLLVN